MSCYSPLKGYLGPEGGITFTRGSSNTGVALNVPCGKCLGCKQDKGRQWATRCMHEARMWKDNWFLTLTYEDEHLPAGGTLVKRDLQLFMKRLRKQKGSGVRFFACGEYGETYGRPHYHVLLFNCHIADCVCVGKNGRGELLYSSADIMELWGKGLVVLGTVTYASANYVARYLAKQVKANGHYGEGKIAEFAVMSRRPGLGRRYYEKFGQEVRDHDNVIVDSRAQRVPRYYDNLTADLSEDVMKVLKRLRKQKAFSLKLDNTSERRRVKEKVAALALERRNRSCL